MGRIIIAVPNSPAGEIALKHIQQQPTFFDVTIKMTLGGALSPQPVPNERYRLDLTLKHTYLLLTTEKNEFDVITRILRHHNNPQARPGNTRGFVEVGDIDRPMSAALTPAASAALGVPIDLNLGNHANYLTQLNVSAAHAAGVKGKGVTVAIIDTGIDSSITPSPVYVEEYHDIVRNQHLAPIVGGTVTGVNDANGHGSAMAKVIAEVAPDAQLCVIKICDNNPQLWDAMAGFGQALYANADVISFAFGFTTTGNLCCTCGTSGKTQSDVLRLLLDNIAKLNLTPRIAPVVVAPTGNESDSRGFKYPAAYDSVVAVGSVDSAAKRSLFSNYGRVHSTYLMAPGGQEDNTGAIVEWVGEGPSGQKFYGTSPAVAYTVGMIALLKSDPRNVYATRSHLVDNVIHHCSPKPTNVNEQMEYGEGALAF